MFANNWENSIAFRAIELRLQFAGASTSKAQKQLRLPRRQIWREAVEGAEVNQKATHIGHDVGQSLTLLRFHADGEVVHPRRAQKMCDLILLKAVPK